jgi:hypothetical protein
MNGIDAILPVTLSGIVEFLILAGTADFMRRGRDDSSNERAKPESPNPDTSEHTSREWFDVPGVDRSASIDKIKRAYRQQIAKYHPDRVQGLGIELQELAEVKAKEIYAADCAMSAYKYACLSSAPAACPVTSQIWS